MPGNFYSPKHLPQIELHLLAKIFKFLLQREGKGVCGGGRNEYSLLFVI